MFIQENKPEKCTVLFGAGNNACSRLNFSEKAKIKQNSCREQIEECLKNIL